jgi:DMSO/TMAO reductase YedYZ molybdopterin-dependent catalytic subunit
VPPPADGEAVRRELRRRTRRGFLAGGLAAAAGAAGFVLVYNAQKEDEIPWPLRRLLGFNERVGAAAFRRSRLAPEFPAGRAVEPRVNGVIGLAEGYDAASWRLTVERPGADPLRVTLHEIRALPRTESVTELKCIEGWSEVVRWAGVSLLDFAARYRLGTRSGAAPDPDGNPGDLLPYVALATPGTPGADDPRERRYHVGLDAASAFHPQTLLCYEMNGEPLAPDHGAPLRLVIPVKYGIKSIKRVATVRFGVERPADYWAERGYDWYAGH